MFSFLGALGKSEHKRIQDQLSAYLDGELSARDLAAVERHLRTCGECARDLVTLRWTVGLLREVPAVALPRSFTVPVAAVRPARIPRRVGPGYTYLRGATVLAAVLLTLVLSADALSQFFAVSAPTPAPAMVEMEVTAEEAPRQTVVVEKAVVQTVVVEKEVVVESTVVETVAVEAEKVVEEAVAATPPSVERPMAAQPAVTEKSAVAEAQPTPSPGIQTEQRVLATKSVEEEPEKADTGPEVSGTPAPPAAAVEAPTEAAASVIEAPLETPVAELAGERESLAEAVPAPGEGYGGGAPELPEPVSETPPGGGLSPLRWLEIGLLAVVIVLGGATLVARKGR